MNSMSELDLNRQLLDAVSEAMEEPAADWLFRVSLELPIGERITLITRMLDELMAMANSPETVALIEGERIGVGQVISRAQLIGSFLMTRQPRPKMVSNHA